MLILLTFEDVARQNINQFLGTVNFDHGECAVRVNSVDSGLVTDDLKAILTGRVLPEAILLPKVENEEQIKWVRNLLIFLIPKNKIVFQRSTSE